METKDLPKEYSLGIRVAAIAGVVGVLALLLPVLAAAAMAGAWLIALGVLAIVGAAIAKAVPLLGQKWENAILSARKAEARQNPIEQLQNFFLDKRKKVNDFKAATGQINTQIRSLTDMLEKRRKEKPNADLSKQEQSLAAMKSAYSMLVNKYIKAEEALVQLQDVIEDRKFEWNFAKAGQSAISALNATSGEDLVNQMLSDEAHSSVLNNFNSVFADLDMEAAKLSSQNSMDFGNGLTIDVSAIHLVEDKTPVGGGFLRKEKQSVLA